MSREAPKGRITGIHTPRAEYQKALRRFSQNQGAARKREQKRLSQEQLLDILTPTEEELLQAKEAALQGKRNSQNALGYIKMALEYTMQKPKQEVTGDVGIKVIVNTMRREKPVLEITDGDGEVLENLDPGGG